MAWGLLVARHEKRILVVDDDDAIRALLLTVLRRRGYVVDVARNGVEALERCTLCHYSLILLDLMMPLMSGWVFLEELPRQVSADVRPLVVVLTGKEPRKLDPDLVAGTIRKPFDIELLIDTVKGCLKMMPECLQKDDCPQSATDNALM